jgi:hypothetical protein
MRPVRSSETVKLRRDLAQLLRRLRAIRREKLSNEQVAEHIAAALDQASTIGRFIASRTRRDEPGAPIPDVDHRKLLAAEPGPAVAPADSVIAERCA